MRTTSLAASLFALTLSAGCAGTAQNTLLEQAPSAPHLAARLMTPGGAKPVPQGSVSLGADPRFAVRLDAEAVAHVYLVRCSLGACQADPQGHKAQPGVPLLLDGPGGWLRMANAPVEELRVLAAANPLSNSDLNGFTQPMDSREPETATPDKRGPEEKLAALDSRGVAVLTEGIDIAFFSSNIRRARCDLPAPVGPVSRIGARERTATRSISSISALNRLLRVAMPLFRKSTALRCSASKRCASAS